MTKIQVTCAWCGKELLRQPNQREKNKSGLYFCTTKEAGMYYKEHKPYAFVKQMRGYQRPKSAVEQ